MSLERRCQLPRVWAVRVVRVAGGGWRAYMQPGCGLLWLADVLVAWCAAHSGFRICKQCKPKKKKPANEAEATAKDQPTVVHTMASLRAAALAVQRDEAKAKAKQEGAAKPKYQDILTQRQRQEAAFQSWQTSDWTPDSRSPSFRELGGSDRRPSN